MVWEKQNFNILGGAMKDIFQVENSYHLLEGLDSEFLIIAESEEQAKDICLKLLAEDTPSHISTIEENIRNLEKGLNKNWGDSDDAASMFIRKANERNRENVINFKKLLQEFNGYKRECLTARRISSRLKNGHIQYI